MDLPYSAACERNSEPILSYLKQYIKVSDEVLEIGHGTGQHALYFAPRLQAKWFPADIKDHNWIMEKHLELKKHEFVSDPIALEVRDDLSLSKQVSRNFDIVFSANTLHIMSAENVERFCKEIGPLIIKGGLLIIYGPFKFEGEFIGESNASFDYSLKSRNGEMGIRDFEMVAKCLEEHDLLFLVKHDLPSNNHLLVFKKNGS